jgi:3-methylcrotonyl-CoA carboxylase alpha subunit
MADRTIVFRRGEREYRVTLDRDGVASVGEGAPMRVRVVGPGEVRVGGESQRSAWVAAAGETRWVFLDGEVFEFEARRQGRRRASTGARESLAAPMPASVVRVDAAPGDRVCKGDSLIILEAMKMELPVRAPADGIVAAVHCKAGDLVKPGVPLIDLE